MKKTNIIIFIIITLAIGLGIGYKIGVESDAGKTQLSDSNQQAVGQQNMEGSHMMPNGQMMSNSGGNSAPSMSMSDMMASMNAELQGKTGDEFDQAFLAEMIVHHQGAVLMAELATKNAKHIEIKNLAEAIISAQKKEISEMEAWEKDWYGR